MSTYNYNCRGKNFMRKKTIRNKHEKSIQKKFDRRNIQSYISEQTDQTSTSVWIIVIKGVTIAIIKASDMSGSKNW